MNCPTYLSDAMSVASAELWFGISFGMRRVYGLVLGIVTSYGVGAWSGTAGHVSPQYSPLAHEYNPRYNLRTMILRGETDKLGA
jgi:hypothetical protein